MRPHVFNKRSNEDNKTTTGRTNKQEKIGNDHKTIKHDKKHQLLLIKS